MLKVFKSTASISDYGGIGTVAKEPRRTSSHSPLMTALAPPGHRQLLKGDARESTSQTSGVHLQMKALMGAALGWGEQLNHGLNQLDASINATLDELAALLLGQPQLQPALVTTSGQLDGVRAADRVEKGPHVLMATIRDMLRGHGRLQRRCPGEFIDREYSEVCAEARNGNRNARTAKKLAEQGNRLSGKLKGKR